MFPTQPKRFLRQVLGTKCFLKKLFQFSEIKLHIFGGLFVTPPLV